MTATRTNQGLLASIVSLADQIARDMTDRLDGFTRRNRAAWQLRELRWLVVDADGMAADLDGEHVPAEWLAVIVGDVARLASVSTSTVEGDETVNEMLAALALAVELATELAGRSDEEES